MLTIFHTSSTLRNENVQVAPRASADRDWQVTLAVSSPRAMSHEENVSGVHRLL